MKLLRLLPGAAKKESLEGEVLTFEMHLSRVLEGLWSFTVKLVRDPIKAEDLLQEVILKAYRGLESLKNRNHFKPWIFQIAYREWVSSHRREASVPFLDIPLDENMFVDHNPWDHFPEIETQDRLGEELEKELEHLEEPFRQVVVLKYVEGFDYQEIAQVLDISEGTVASRLFRAKALLKEKLWQYAEEKGWVKDS